MIQSLVYISGLSQKADVTFDLMGGRRMDLFYEACRYATG